MKFFFHFRLHQILLHKDRCCWNQGHIRKDNQCHYTSIPGWRFACDLYYSHILIPMWYFAECRKGFFGENGSKKCNRTKFEMCHVMTGQCKRGRQNEFDVALFQSNDDLLSRLRLPFWLTGLKNDCACVTATQSANLVRDCPVGATFGAKISTWTTHSEWKTFETLDLAVKFLLVFRYETVVFRNGETEN